MSYFVMLPMLQLSGFVTAGAGVARASAYTSLLTWRTPNPHGAAHALKCDSDIASKSETATFDGP